MSRNRRAFNREYKLEAVRLLKQSGRPIGEVARELGVRADLLAGWRRQFEADGAVPARTASSVEEENRRLVRENVVLRQERDFAKKAAAFFIKGSERGTP